jgi:hypothetical protein
MAEKFLPRSRLYYVVIEEMNFTITETLVGAKLTWESVVDVGASSSSIPGNGARKLA